MTSKENASMLTAYDSNARTGSVKEINVKGDWAQKIVDLLKQDYSFLAYQYSSEAVLFRGMASGLLASIKQHSFADYKSDNPHASLEQALNVYFVSHELSDALTTARLWEDKDDAAIVVISSNYFNKCYTEKQAAMMATAEPGFVFKYPLFADPIPLQEMIVLLVNVETQEQLKRHLSTAEFATIESRLIVVNDNEAVKSRADYELAIRQYLNNQGLQTAVPVETDDYPGKQ